MFCASSTGEHAMKNVALDNAHHYFFTIDSIAASKLGRVIFREFPIYFQNRLSAACQAFFLSKKGIICEISPKTQLQHDLRVRCSYRYEGSQAIDSKECRTGMSILLSSPDRQATHQGLSSRAWQSVCGIPGHGCMELGLSAEALQALVGLGRDRYFLWT